MIVVCATDITATAVTVAVAVAAVVVLSLSPPAVRLVCQTTLVRWRWGAGGEKKTKQTINYRSGARESVPKKF
jgi:hypothetical protein